MTALSAFGLVAVMMMLGCYAFEAHSPWFVFGFAIACGLGSTMPFAGCGQRLEGGLQEHHALGKMNRHGVASSLHEPSDRGLDAVRRRICAGFLQEGQHRLVYRVQT